MSKCLRFIDIQNAMSTCDQMLLLRILKFLMMTQIWYEDWMIKYDDSMIKYDDSMIKYDDWMIKYDDWMIKYDDLMIKWPKKDQTVTRGCPTPPCFGTGIPSDEARGRFSVGSATGLDPIELFWPSDRVGRGPIGIDFTRPNLAKARSGRIYRLPPLPPTPLLHVPLDCVVPCCCRVVTSRRFVLFLCFCVLSF